jgi:hypothetical protein
MANTPAVPRFAVFVVLLALLAPACGKEIGDSCSTNVDCEQDGTRDCDLSQPGGYCTVNGCDEKSCPSEAVCIRIFPYETPGAPCTTDANCSSADLLCLPDGFCVPRASERRYCERNCGSNGDCRGGYECREAGIEGRLSSTNPSGSTNTYGSIALVANATPNTVVRFCAPAP